MKPFNVKQYRVGFFKVLDETKKSQVAVMTIKPGGDSGPGDLHKGDQVVYVIEGEADLELAGEMQKLPQGYAIIIPAKTPHQIYNHGQSDLFVFCVYAPPSY